MASAIAVQIPSSLSQPDPAQFAISTITLHNASASPALSISVLPNSNVAVRSHTEDLVEFVQDTEVSPMPLTEAARRGEGAVGALLLKIQAGEGVQLAFELRGHVLDSTIPTPLPVITVDDDRKGKSDESNAAKMTENISTANASSIQGSLYFAEAHSETEIQDMRRESEFERQLKEHNICVVEAKPLDVENKAVGQGNAHQKYSWTWNFPSRAHGDDDVLCRKAVYAFLFRNPSCGTIEILSQLSFWIVKTPATEQSAGSKFSMSQSSVSTANGRHWRRASTPERFGNRPSLHTKSASIPPSYTSLPSLPDAAAGLVGSGLLADSPGSATGSLNLNPSPFTHDTEDGPLFRATVAECENHIRDMKASTKRIIKAAQTVLETRKSLVASEEAFVKELEGFKPAEPLVNSYLRPMSQNLAETSEILSNQMRSLLIEPLTQFYANDIKATEAYRKSFEDESKEYYQFLSRYMAMKQENNRKKSEADAKYEKKRRHFEIKRFEYWCFLQDMRVGGSKSESILHHLTNYSEKHCRNMTDIASLANDLNPGLVAIAADLSESQKRSAVVYRERQERKRELLESYDEGLNSVPQLPALAKSGSSMVATTSYSSNNTDAPLEINLDIPTSTLEAFDSQYDGAAGADQKSAPGSYPTQPEIGSAQLNNNSTSRFSGIRDLEHQDIDASSALGKRKEGFLFATSRPSLHNNSTVLEKPSITWHKYWCVVSEGYLHEYSHWKKGATMLHNEPTNLKISTVRPCRDQDRRFCFEVITPKYRRVYQATSTEDMNSWVSVISNAIQSLLNGTSSYQNLDPTASGVDGSTSIIGRSSIEQTLHGLPLERHAFGSASANGSGDLSGAQELGDMEHLGTWLLKIMRESSPSNNFCAECGAKNPDWCAINLGILICIECSGIHRSLGTHISKVRSFTLDTTSYTRDLFDFIRSVGNEISNLIWEANLIQSAAEAQVVQSSTKVVFRRPLVNDTREYKASFIQKKYVHRAFVNQQRFSEGAETPEEKALLATKALFQAAVANNIPDVIAAFAAGADLNAVQEAELENETVGDGDAGSVLLNEGLLQSSLEGFTLNSESSSRLSRSTIASSIGITPGTNTGVGQETQQEQQSLPENQDPSFLSMMDPHSSSFMVMQTSPLLVALRHGVPFSLDDQYEVYPMAEFMLQNGAASNLSVEVRIIDRDADGAGNAVASDGSVGLSEISSTPHQNALLLTMDLPLPSSESGWDLSQVDPEDNRHFQQRSNRRSLGQVVHMRGEGGGTAMEYLRAKSVARGELMPGSPPTNHNDPTFSNSPPSGAPSPRLRPQSLTPATAGSASSPTSVLSSPSAAGKYSTAVFRHQPTSNHQDISTLFQRRRESDGGLGPSLHAAVKATDSDKKTGPYKLQNPAIVPSSPTTQQHTIDAPSQSLQSTSQNSNSRAHKVKATLSKSLRLSAAYIKNNMMKDEKEHSMPSTMQVAVSPLSTPAASPPGIASSSSKQADASSVSSSTSYEAPPSSADQFRHEAPLSGPYVLLHKKGSPPTLNPNPNAP